MTHAYVDAGQTLGSGRAADGMSRSAPGRLAWDPGWGSACALIQAQNWGAPRPPPQDVLLRWLESVSLLQLFVSPEAK